MELAIQEEATGAGSSEDSSAVLEEEATGALTRDAVLAISVTEIPRQDVSLLDLIEKTGEAPCILEQGDLSACKCSNVSTRSYVCRKHLRFANTRMGERSGILAPVPPGFDIFISLKPLPPPPPPPPLPSPVLQSPSPYPLDLTIFPWSARRSSPRADPRRHSDAASIYSRASARGVRLHTQRHRRPQRLRLYQLRRRAPL